MAITILSNTNFQGRDRAIGQTIMLFYIILVVPAIIITLEGQICNAQLASVCNRNFNYTKGSEFESNLNTVFNRLVQNTSQTGFNTSVYGQSPNQIYGLLNCRGDTTAEQCYNCSQRAIAAIRRSDGCGNGVGGTIWMDVCFLRYENFTFSGKLSPNIGLYTYITTTVSSPDIFNEAVSNLLSNLSSKAESGSKLYASDTTTDSLFRKIYGLVQCWRDISSDDCTTCLSNTINSISVNFPGNPGVQGLNANCIIRYEIYSFFDSALSPPPAATPVINTHCGTLCNHTYNYTRGSAFETNLNIVLKYLVQNTSKSRVSGLSPDQISRRLLCTVDTTADQCYECSQQATTIIRQQCPNAVGGTVLCAFCSLRYENYSFLGITSTTGINPYRLPPPVVETPGAPVKQSDRKDTKKSSHRMPIILGVVGGFLLALLVCLFATGRRLKSAIKRRGYEVQPEDRGKIEEDTLISEDPQLVAFKMETLLASTENFHDDNKLGQGGFGPVYKVTFASRASTCF